MAVCLIEYSWMYFSTRHFTFSPVLNSIWKSIPKSKKLIFYHNFNYRYGHKTNCKKHYICAQRLQLLSSTLKKLSKKKFGREKERLEEITARFVKYRLTSNLYCLLFYTFFIHVLFCRADNPCLPGISLNLKWI